MNINKYVIIAVIKVYKYLGLEKYIIISKEKATVISNTILLSKDNVHTFKEIRPGSHHW